MFLFVILLVSAVASVAGVAIGRPRPFGVEVLGDWSATPTPTAAVAALGLSLIGVLYTLVPAGRPGTWPSGWRGIPIGLLIASRLYLAVDHPTDVLASLVGHGRPRGAVPPAGPRRGVAVSYRRGRRAHLDVSGRRRASHRRALDEQLGLDVAAIRPFGLEGSAGSTPLHITTRSSAGGVEQMLFGKLYTLATSVRPLVQVRARHRLRAPRGREPFSSVRRLVEYEDHLLRLLREDGLSTPEPFGFVEITPEREYLIVTEFLPAGGDRAAEVDDDVIDDAMAIVRRMWTWALPPATSSRPTSSCETAASS